MFRQKTLLLFLLLIINFLIAQKANVLIEYQYKYNTLDFRAYLLGNNEESLFFFAKNKDENYEKLELNNFKGLNRYFVVNYEFETKLCYQIPILNGDTNAFKSKLTKDQFELNWKITTEKKKILDYNCTLATVTFRGNKYKAWFTTEINSNIFPWKLKGLPGIILEFEDEAGLMKGDAVSVSINKEVSFPMKTMAFFEENKKTASLYKEFIIVENKMLYNNMQQKVANLPVGTKYQLPELRQMQLEKSFEWETEPSKP